MYEPRDNQLRAINDLRAAVASGKRRIICEAPTGYGKTVLATFIVHAAFKQGRKCLFMADNRELVDQCSEKLTTNGLRHGIIMAGSKKRDPFAEAQVVSKDTLYSRCIRRDVMDLPEADLIIVDEAHLSMAKTWQTLLAAYPDAVVIGLTATPERNDGLGLGCYWETIAKAATYKELLDGKFLVPARVVCPDVPDLKGVKVSGGDYNQRELCARMVQHRDLTGNIVLEWMERAVDRTTIVFTSGKQHGLAVRDQFMSKNVEALYLDGDFDLQERTDIVHRFRERKFPVLVVVMLFTRGFDVPHCSCAVLARPTRSRVLYRQMAGRILRPYPGKTDALIIDHSGASLDFGFPDEDIEWNLSRTRREKKEEEAKRSERKLFRCSQCKSVYEGARYCPICGAITPVKVLQGKPVKMKPGRLRELKRKDALKESTPGELQNHWNSCLGAAIGSNRKVGMAAKMFQDRYGVLPWQVKGLERLPRGKEQWQMQARDFYRQHVSRSA